MLTARLLEVVTELPVWVVQVVWALGVVGLKRREVPL